MRRRLFPAGLGGVDAALRDGHDALARRDFAGARAAFERALAADPLHGAAHVALAELDRREGRLDAAIAHYRSALARLPDEPGLVASLAGLLMDAGDWDDARFLIERASGDSPALAAARERLARLRPPAQD
ncbi:MAG: tetratricopeptide repeat protein [Burkholderiales bacterium]|nr:tetratricopeptide repeat protein [Burkholderiales bacterium]